MTAQVTIKHISINECEFPNDLVETSSHFKKTTLEKVLDDIYKKKKTNVSSPRKLTIPQNDFKVLAQKFSEEVTTNAIDDLKELDLWYNGSKQYPFLGKYIPLKIDRNDLPEGSKSAKECLGSSMMGYFIELFPNIKPIVRNVGTFPDCICLSNRPKETVQFWEAKCRKDYAIRSDMARIYNELDRNHCQFVCIVNSEIVNFHPLEVNLQIYKFVLENQIPGLKLSRIVYGLKPQIVATAAADGISAGEALTGLLGATVLEDKDVNLDDYALKKILAECDKKVEKIREDPDLNVKSKHEVFSSIIQRI